MATVQLKCPMGAACDYKTEAVDTMVNAMQLRCTLAWSTSSRPRHLRPKSRLGK